MIDFTLILLSFPHCMYTEYVCSTTGAVICVAPVLLEGRMTASGTQLQC